MRSAKKAAPAVAAIAALAFALHAQTRSEFDAVSVKRNSSGPQSPANFRTFPGRLAGVNVGLKLLISNAYGVEGFQILDAPSWADLDRYDVEGKTTNAVTGKELYPMLQSLLEDRFKLKVHREKKEGKVYRLTVVKSGLKLPPFQPESCIAAVPNGPPRPPAPGEKPPCGVLRPGRSGSSQAWDAAGLNVSYLVRVLALMLGRTVDDQTGIKDPLGAFHLEFAPPNLTNNPVLSADSAGPSIFTALQEQLGLKLESATGLVEMLIIDHVERPSEN